MLATIARETPFKVHPNDPARPKAPAEPVLNVGNIQGNVLAGFNKDYQTLVFLKVTNVDNPCVAGPIDSLCGNHIRSVGL